MKIKAINNKNTYCQTCGMLDFNCICEKVQVIASEADYWLLTTDKECQRPSNTGRLLKLVNPSSTRLLIWSRKDGCQALEALLASGIYQVYLVYPEEADSKAVSLGQVGVKASKKAFVLIDATWKESKRILRLTESLSALPRVALPSDLTSDYAFRRGAVKGQLCTYEAAVELMVMDQEVENSRVARANFDLYCKAFKATVHNHSL